MFVRMTFPLLRLLVAGVPTRKHQRRITMKSTRWSVLPLVLLLAMTSANAWIRSPATGFATLPPGAVNPEGIAADTAGNLYVTTFDPKGLTPGQVIVFSSNGKLLRQVVVAG